MCHTAEFVGVKKYIPPYLDPSLTVEDYLTGVCFASAGAGFDPLTSQYGVIYLSLSPSIYLKYTHSRE